MTGITRETLELAALAGGIHHVDYSGVDYSGSIGLMQVDKNGYHTVIWSPRTDIADAARLALKLGMWVNRGMASAFVGSEVVEVVVGRDDTQPDMERAYCEAITMCAAEIGRRVKEAK